MKVTSHHIMPSHHTSYISVTSSCSGPALTIRCAGRFRRQEGRQRCLLPCSGAIITLSLFAILTLIFALSFTAIFTATFTVITIL